MRSGYVGVHVRVVLDWCVTVPSLYGQCSRQPWYRVHNVGGKTIVGPMTGHRQLRAFRDASASP